MTAAVEQVISVGLGEIHTAVGGDAVLMALGLGSCIGVALWHPKTQVGGMAHVVLPEPMNASVPPSPKFANTAVPMLLERVRALGAEIRGLRCVIAGGAQVLAAGPMKHNFRIGERNIEAVIEALSRAGLRPHAQDCGGNTGRSFRLVVQDGRMSVKRLGQTWQEI